MTLIPQECTSGLDPLNIIYFMQVGCKSDVVNLFGSNSAQVKKESVAFTVVFCDLFGSIMMFLLFAALKSIQHATAQEIDDAEVTAKDFGVEIRGLPPHDNVREFKAALWQYVEGINEKGPNENHAILNIPDENQNNLMNITFGMSDYGKMNYMMRMADLFHEKKKLEKHLKLDPSREAYLTKQIEAINKKGQLIMREMETYVRKSRSKAVVAFAQFQSMTAKEKFFKNAHLSWWKKMC